ncbi:MAG: IclR family transcriptional regulator [Armatimonadota bacterium]|nr:IclR family transcriptional regulator [Armatimonadota bacterium]
MPQPPWAAILETLASSSDGLTVSELAGALGTYKGVVSRTLGTLVALGYVRANTATRRYTLGLPLVALAFRFADMTGFPGVCQPVLQDLADATGELAQLAVVEHHRVLFVAKAEGRDQRIRMASLVGQFAPLHATAAGKVYLASLPEAEALGIAVRAGLRSFTRHTITTRTRLRRELHMVRRLGYATVEEELVDGAGAVGVPVRVGRHGGRVAGAVVLSGPTFRLPAARKRELVPLLLAAAERLGSVWPLHGSGAAPAAATQVFP